MYGLTVCLYECRRTNLVACNRPAGRALQNLHSLSRCYTVQRVLLTENIFARALMISASENTHVQTVILIDNQHQEILLLRYHINILLDNALCFNLSSSCSIINY